MKVSKAIFPVAGLGTRFLPATKSMPKEMLCVVDKPIIQYAVEEARASGIEHVIIVTGRTHMYESIVKGENILEAGLPESFNVLVKELQALALDVELI